MKAAESGLISVKREVDGVAVAVIGIWIVRSVRKKEEGCVCIARTGDINRKQISPTISSLAHQNKITKSTHKDGVHFESKYYRYLVKVFNVL